MIADLHIHSRFSMATSKEGTPENMDFWARKKGISLIGTGDFTHPVWREELKERLVSEGNGLYRLRDAYVKEESRKFPGEGTRFVVSGEISSIYKKNGKTRKVHNVILLPGLEAADLLFERKIVKVLQKIVAYYPVGTKIRLNTGETGIVVCQTDNSIRPVVAVLDQDNQMTEIRYDLAKNKKISILQLV